MCISEEDIRNNIEHNYKRILALEDRVYEIDNIDERLKYISVVGLLYATHVTGLYSSGRLEKGIVKSGLDSRIDYKRARNNRILHVMTEASSMGGHTRLVSNWIRCSMGYESSIVFTDQNEADVPGFLKCDVQKSGGKLWYLVGSFLNRAEGLLDISKDYGLIILHMHMYDVIPVLAYGNKKWKTPVFFCNHADFRFSYGFSVSDAIIHMTDFDVRKGIEYRGIARERNARLDFPVVSLMDSVKEPEDRRRDLIRKRYSVADDEKLIVSMGEDYKYEDVPGISFAGFISRFVNESEGKCKCLIIGADPHREKWINAKQRTQGKVEALGILPFEEATAIISAGDLYISSFPMRAAGANIAKKYSLPTLSYMATERGKEYLGDTMTSSLDELSEKMKDALYVNPQKYIVHTDYAERRQSWFENFTEIIRNYDNHTVYEIHPKRRIEQHEIINYTLLERNARWWLEHYFARHPGSRYILENL